MRLTRGLRVKTLALPTAILGVLAISACILGVDRLLEGFARLEAEELDHVRDRARHLVQKHLAAEQQKVRDWAEWDDAANWLSGGNPDFPLSNLTDSTLSILGEDQLIYWDAKLKPAGSLVRPARLPAGFELELRYLVSLGHFPWSGMLRTDSGLVVATLRPVTNSEGRSLRRGWLAMVHRIDSSVVSSFSADLQCKVRFDLDPRVRSADSMAILNSNSLAVGIPIEVEDGKPATMWMDLERPLHQLGLAASRTYFLHFFGATISFVALGLLLLERLVLFRLMRLTKGVETIREQGASAPMVHDPRPDEIGKLSWRIDEMVSSLRKTQAQLETALDETQTANRARVNFLASMTHELRTPLNGVIGLTEFVLKSERSPESREALELSRGAALGLLETINGVLEYARLEKGAVELVVDDADLESSMVDPIKVLGSVAAQKGVSLQVEIDPRLPRLVRLDAARLRQVLNNLVGNAIKFTDKGDVIVRAMLSKASAERFDQDLLHGPQVEFEIEVVDSGVGIHPDRLQAIFEPFEQATSQTAIKYGGTGLGLTIANSLVRAMNSEIAVQSLLGQGSRFGFSLTLPVVDPKPLVAPLATRRSVRVRLMLASPGLEAIMERILARMSLHHESAVPGIGPCDHGSSHLVVLDSRALIESHELADLPPATSLLVLADSEHIQDIRIHLQGFRSEIVALPTGPGAIAKAIGHLALPKARIVVALAGLVLRGMVTGMIERSRLLAVEIANCQDALEQLETGSCQTAIVDLDDPQWLPFLRRAPADFHFVGLADDPSEHTYPNIVAKPVQSRRLMQAIEVALENVPDGPDS